MTSGSPLQLLILNSGSLSLKFALYDLDGAEIRMSGKLTRIGLMMGIRTGDLDSGVLLYLLTNNPMDVPTPGHLLNNESGLRGVLGLSHDVRELLEAAPHNPHATEAIGLFCYTAKKPGTLVAVLNELDTLVFTGGTGENAPVISPDGSRVTVRVIPANEEQIIARHTRDVLSNANQPINV
ncbi:MAG: hypothetical protein LH609_21820 [Rudanella sp.]|nr:hypothetical protein [Rudanella sp.]